MSDDPVRPRQARPEPRTFGAWLTLWVTLAVALQAFTWLTGFRPVEIGEAVDRGAVRVGSVGAGAVGDDLIRKAVRSQRDTLRFWAVLAFLGDFLAEPLSLALRAVAVATALSAVAALAGRPVGFDRALAEGAAAQGYWVAGLAVRVALMAALRRQDAETSLALALPPGTYHAAVWLVARQFDAFAALGWWEMAAGGRRRGQVGWAGSLAVVAALGLAEGVARVALGLAFGAGMRLSVWAD